MDKNTNTIDEDANTIAANTQIFLQIQNPLPLEWHPPNTNPIDKNTNTIDEDANTQIFLQIHSSSTRLAPSKPGLISSTCRWQPPTSSQIVAEKNYNLLKKWNKKRHADDDHIPKLLLNKT